jgi:hypothetical protein
MLILDNLAHSTPGDSNPESVVRELSFSNRIVIGLSEMSNGYCKEIETLESVMVG